MNIQEGFKLKSLTNNVSNFAKKGKNVSKTVVNNVGNSAKKVGNVAKKNKKTTVAIAGVVGIGAYSASTGTNPLSNVNKLKNNILGLAGNALGIDPKKMSEYMSYIKNIVGIIMAIYLYFIFGRIGLIAFILIIFVYKFYSKFMTTSESYQNINKKSKIYPFNS